MKTVTDVLVFQMKEGIETLKEHMGAGKCENYAEYQYACGQIRGLKSALNNTIDLAKQQMENDDD
jgi:hypothetical protein